MSHWVQITAGQGPAECFWVVKRVLKRVLKEAASLGIECTLIDSVSGEERDTLKSALVSLEGDESAVLEFIGDWEGTIHWVGQSTFRPKHKRKNWYVGIVHLCPPESTYFSEADVRFETMRSSGPGGQHANKTDSCVRATHTPTGLSAMAQEERSQSKNRKLALTRLALRFAEQGDQDADRSKREQWSQHTALERGNAVRVFRGKEIL